MKKIQFLIAAMIFASPFYSFAQVENEDDDDTVVIADEDENDDENAVEDDDDIEMPEGLTEDVDSLLLLYDNQEYLKIDPDCNFPNVNPSYDDEVYKERLAKMPTIMEMPYNEVVRKFINRYAEKNRRTVSMMLGAQNFFMPIFEQALESYNVPLELKYLPVIESALNPTAVSHAGAAGLWQFMLSTGKTYGLEVNSLVDERRDPLKSSYAAAHYLSDLYRIFGDWTLVIAAYNCGPANVNKAIHKAGGVKDYWKIYRYLPSETRGYVPAFIAANYIMNYYCEHNICPMVTTLPSRTDTLELNRDVHFDQIANVLGIDKKKIEALNPQYRRDVINGSSKPSVLRLEPQEITAFIDNEDEIYAYRTDELLNKRNTVEVEDGSSDDSSSSRHSSSKSSSEKKEKKDSKSKKESSSKKSSKDKKSSNSKRDKSSSKDKKSSKSKKEKKSSSSTHQIKEGETLGGIAHRNGTTVEKLRKLNPNIKGDNIRAGKTLRVK